MIGFASDIAEMDELSLRDTDVECLGAGKARIKYVDAVSAILNTVPYWDHILDRISDQDSLSILHGMMQYFLLPDPSFLLFNEEEDHHCPMKEYVIDGIDEIKEHGALIHEARYGIRFILPVADAIYELAKTLALLSALNIDLMFLGYLPSQRPSLRRYMFSPLLPNLTPSFQTSMLTVFKK